MIELRWVLKKGDAGNWHVRYLCLLQRNRNDSASFRKS